MLSRVAENLYWMSRYLERAENVARLLDIGMFLELDAAELGVHDGSAPVEVALTILACRDAFHEAHAPAFAKSSESADGDGRFRSNIDPGERDALLRFLTFDRSNPQSILSMIARARENGRGTQESLGGEVWSEINRLYLYLSGPKARQRFLSSPFRFYGSITRSCILVDGLIQHTLPRDEVYHFLELGRYIERVDVMGRILHAKCQNLLNTDRASADVLHPTFVHWTSLLRSTSAYAPYLRIESDRVDPEGVVRFLVLNLDFPRSIRHGVSRCRDALREISGEDEDDYGYGSEAERLLGRLDSDLRYIDVAEIFDRGLLPFLRGIQQTCLRVGDEIQNAYFAT
jgi:uncharacterized alpha-E superfamily protein